MLAAETMSPELARATWLTDAAWLAQVEPWTDDRPDPAHWINTMSLESARRRVEEALRAEPGPIVVCGPTGHGKTLLLRSLRIRPPSGFAPLFVPFANVEPDELAGWILAATRRRIGPDPAARLASLLRAHAQVGERTLLLIDEVQAMPPATVSKLLEIVTRSGVTVSVVLAGLAGEALDSALGALPRSIKKIVVCDRWSRADAELLLTQVALTLGIPSTAVIEAVDVDTALRAGAGNPRLVRAALAAQLRAAHLSPALVAAYAAPPPPTQRLASASIARVPAADAIPITPAEARATPRPQRAPSATRPALLLAGATTALLSIVAETFALTSLAARIDRNQEGIAAVRRRAVQEFAAGVSQLQRSAAMRTLCARVWLDRAVRSAFVASERSARVIWARGHRLAAVARDRSIAVTAQLRSLPVGGSGVVWNEAQVWARQVCAAQASALRALYPHIQRVVTHAARRLHYGFRLLRFSARWALTMVGAIAAVTVFTGVARAPVITELPGEGARTIGEPILFRVNSYPWSTVEVDGVESGTTPFTTSLESGSHHFRAAMADGRVLEKSLVVSALHDRVAFR
jgi:AAA domain